MIGRSSRSVGDAQKEIGANGVAIAADVTESTELDAVFQTVREKYGRIDVLYANAGAVLRRAVPFFRVTVEAKWPAMKEDPSGMRRRSSDRNQT